MFVDDLCTAKELPFNQRATDLFHLHCHSNLRNHIAPASARGSRYLAGTAVLFEEQVLFD